MRSSTLFLACVVFLGFSVSFLRAQQSQPNQPGAPASDVSNIPKPITDTFDKITVRNILRRHHREPAPQRWKRGMSWSPFLTMHWEVLAAMDLFTVEVAT